MMSDQPNINDLAEAVERATASYSERKIAAAQARHMETNALNHLNEAQKALSDAVALMAKNAPRDSRWGQAQNGRAVIVHG
jgi:hypothetical protein